MRRNLFPILAIFAVVLSACATITGGTTQQVAIDSNPSGAKLTIEGVEYKTPALVSVGRAKSHPITIEKEGYEKKTLLLEGSFRGWATIGGNILWLLPGVVVDAVTGAMYEFKDDKVTVTLEPKK